MDNGHLGGGVVVPPLDVPENIKKDLQKKVFNILNIKHKKPSV